MVLKLIDATQAKPGTTILIDGEPYSVKSNDISKTGKHGASKCRIEAIEIFSGKKKVIAVPGDTKFEVPMIDKRKGQVLSINENRASVMDLESFETLDMEVPKEMLAEVTADSTVEYWDIEGRKVIKRKL